MDKFCLAFAPGRSDRVCEAGIDDDPGHVALLECLEKFCGSGGP